MSDATLPDKIAHRLRRDILTGKLPPGAPIKERDNAAEMGVSRTPMREAIRILSKEGLVSLRPARSPVVAQPPMKEVIDAVQVLTALELLSGELACRNATEEQIDGIASLQEHMAEAYDRVDTLDLFDIDMGFHQAIALASNNQSLAETHGAYLRRLWRVRYLSASQKKSRERVLRQHLGIVEGLRARDPDRVRQEIQSHLEHLELNIRRRMTEESAAGNGAA